MVLLVLLAEIISMKGTKKIIDSMSNDIVLDFADEGYKLDYEKARAVIGNARQERKAKEKKIIEALKIIGSLLVFVMPGINMLYGYLSCLVDKNVSKKVLKENDCLIPMNGVEKTVYNNIQDRNEKYEYIVNCSRLKQVIININKIKDLALIGTDRVLPLGYTLDEVKQLNQVTNQTYLLGKVDDNSTAFIGVPEEERNFKKVVFTETGTPYDFEPMSEEEAKNRRFIVYPFQKSQEKDVDAVVNEIRANRNKQERAIHGTINRQVTDCDSYIEMEGPRLTRILK